MRSWLIRAPSNIALIKYMGKRDPELNLPENASLSLTLDSLCTWVELEAGHEPGVKWIPEVPRLDSVPGNFGLVAPLHTEKAALKVQRHFNRVGKAVEEVFPRYGLKARSEAPGLALRSANTFPESSGIASSASSFAAMTLGFALAWSEDPRALGLVYEKDKEFRRSLAALSRQGSGSSCRSFEGPWVLWDGENAGALETRMPEMAHFVILVSSEPKAVSSSEAHHRVKTSPLWPERPERVSARVRDLESALGEGEVAAVARISWAEAWEMHSLFHTCSEPFTYWEPGTLEALRWLAPFVTARGGEENPPIVTLDAGPNVHLIVEESVRALWRKRISDRFPGFRVLEDAQGTGAKIVRAG